MPSPRFEISDLTPWIEVRFDRSSGPGGQHVNKVSTRATLLFDFAACERLTDYQRDLVRRRLTTRLASDGRLRVVSQRARTQPGNRGLAEERLLTLLESALDVPKPRKATRPTRAAHERRLNEKRRRGDIKSLRQRRPNRDE